MNKEELREQIEKDLQACCDLSFDATRAYDIYDYILNDLPNNREYVQYLIDIGKIEVSQNETFDIIPTVK